MKYGVVYNILLLVGIQLLKKGLKYFALSRGPPSAISLVVEWLRIHLPMQGTRVQSLVQEDTIGHGAARLLHPSS